MKIVFIDKKTGEEIKNRNLAVDRNGIVLEVSEGTWECYISYPEDVEFALKEEDE